MDLKTLETLLKVLDDGKELDPKPKQQTVASWEPVPTLDTPEPDWGLGL